MNAQQGPTRPADPHAPVRAKAELRQATWEATQFMSFDEIRDYVEAVLREVETDEP
jgi:hypothetical protein